MGIIEHNITASEYSYSPSSMKSRVKQAYKPPRQNKSKKQEDATISANVRNHVIEWIKENIELTDDSNNTYMVYPLERLTVPYGNTLVSYKHELTYSTPMDSAIDSVDSHVEPRIDQQRKKRFLEIPVNDIFVPTSISKSILKLSVKHNRDLLEPYYKILQAYVPDLPSDMPIYIPSRTLYCLIHLWYIDHNPTLRTMFLERKYPIATYPLNHLLHLCISSIVFTVCENPDTQYITPSDYILDGNTNSYTTNNITLRTWVYERLFTPNGRIQCQQYIEAENTLLLMIMKPDTLRNITKDDHYSAIVYTIDSMATTNKIYIMKLIENQPNETGEGTVKVPKIDTQNDTQNDTEQVIIKYIKTESDVELFKATEEKTYLAGSKNIHHANLKDEQDVTNPASAILQQPSHEECRTMVNTYIRQHEHTSLCPLPEYLGSVDYICYCPECRKRGFVSPYNNYTADRYEILRLKNRVYLVDVLQKLRSLWLLIGKDIIPNMDDTITGLLHPSYTDYFIGYLLPENSNGRQYMNRWIQKENVTHTKDPIAPIESTILDTNGLNRLSISPLPAKCDITTRVVTNTALYTRATQLFEYAEDIDTDCFNMNNIRVSTARNILLHHVTLFKQILSPTAMVMAAASMLAKYLKHVTTTHCNHSCVHALYQMKIITEHELDRYQEHRKYNSWDYLLGLHFANILTCYHWITLEQLLDHVDIIVSLQRWIIFERHDLKSVGEIIFNVYSSVMIPYDSYWLTTHDLAHHGEWYLLNHGHLKRTTYIPNTRFDTKTPSYAANGWLLLMWIKLGHLRSYLSLRINDQYISDKLFETPNEPLSKQSLEHLYNVLDGIQLPRLEQIIQLNYHRIFRKHEITFHDKKEVHIEVNEKAYNAFLSFMYQWHYFDQFLIEDHVLFADKVIDMDYQLLQSTSTKVIDQHCTTFANDEVTPEYLLERYFKDYSGVYHYLPLATNLQDASRILMSRTWLGYYGNVSHFRNMRKLLYNEPICNNTHPVLHNLTDNDTDTGNDPIDELLLTNINGNNDWYNIDERGISIAQDLPDNLSLKEVNQLYCINETRHLLQMFNFNIARQKYQFVNRISNIVKFMISNDKNRVHQLPSLNDSQYQQLNPTSNSSNVIPNTRRLAYLKNKQDMGLIDTTTTIYNETNLSLYHIMRVARGLELNGLHSLCNNIIDIQKRNTSKTGIVSGISAVIDESLLIEASLMTWMKKQDKTNVCDLIKELDTKTTEDTMLLNFTPLRKSIKTEIPLVPHIDKYSIITNTIQSDHTAYISISLLYLFLFLDTSTCKSLEDIIEKVQMLENNHDELFALVHTINRYGKTKYSTIYLEAFVKWIVTDLYLHSCKPGFNLILDLFRIA